jgi:hypothetical protein
MISAAIRASDSDGPLYTTDRATIFNLNPDRKIVAVDVERDLDILWVQVWPGRIMETGDLAACQYQALHRPPIA